MVLHHYQLVSCFQQWVETSEPVLRVLFQKIRWYAKQLVSVLYLTYHVFLIKQPIVTIYRNEQLGVCFVRSQDIAKYQLFCGLLHMVCSSLYLSYSVNHHYFCLQVFLRSCTRNKYGGTCRIDSYKIWYGPMSSKVFMLLQQLHFHQQFFSKQKCGR